MNIGLDFDGTVTRDFDLWYEFIEMSKTMGHKVYIVTMRNELFEGDALHEKIGDKCDGIIFTSRYGKREYVRKHHNLVMDVWIDDKPQYVTQDHATLDEMNESLETHEKWVQRCGHEAEK